MDMEQLIHQTEALSWEDLHLSLGSDFAKEENELALIGKIVATRPLNRISLHASFRAAWSFLSKFHIEDLEENLFLFTFQSAGDKMWIFNQIPWNFKGHLLILKNCPAKITWREIQLNSSSFHIQIHGLTRNHMTKENAKKIGNAMGNFLGVDTDHLFGLASKKFIRIKVDIDITKPLKQGFWEPRDLKCDTWVSFKYERLSDICYGCGRIGHSQTFCNSWNPNSGQMSFEPWLRVESPIFKMENPTHCDQDKVSSHSMNNYPEKERKQGNEITDMDTSDSRGMNYLALISPMSPVNENTDKLPVETLYGKGKAILTEEEIFVRGNSFVKGVWEDELDFRQITDQGVDRVLPIRKQPIKVRSAQELILSSFLNDHHRNPHIDAIGKQRKEILTFGISMGQKLSQLLMASPTSSSTPSSGPLDSKTLMVSMEEMNSSTVDYSNPSEELMDSLTTRQYSFNPSEIPSVQIYPNLDPSINQAAKIASSIAYQDPCSNGNWNEPKELLSSPEDLVASQLKTKVDSFMQTNKDGSPLTENDAASHVSKRQAVHISHLPSNPNRFI